MPIIKNWVQITINPLEKAIHLNLLLDKHLACHFILIIHINECLQQVGVLLGGTVNVKIAKP